MRFLTQTDDAHCLSLQDLKGKEFTTEKWNRCQDLHQKTGATIVGRSRKFKVVVGSEDDTVNGGTESARVATYAQQEGACAAERRRLRKMLTWAHDATLK